MQGNARCARTASGGSIRSTEFASPISENLFVCRYYIVTSTYSSCTFYFYLFPYSSTKFFFCLFYYTTFGFRNCTLDTQILLCRIKGTKSWIQLYARPMLLRQNRFFFRNNFLSSHRITPKLYEKILYSRNIYSSWAELRIISLPH